MDEEEFRQFWAEGEAWIIKRHNDEFFHRPDGKYGEWQTGLPPGVFPLDAELLFHE